MYSYEVSLPNGSTFDVDSEEELTDAQAYQAVMTDLQSQGSVRPGVPPPKWTLGSLSDWGEGLSKKLLPIETMAKGGLSMFQNPFSTPQTFIDESGREVLAGGAPLPTQQETNNAALNMALGGLHMKAKPLASPAEAVFPMPKMKQPLALPAPGESAAPRMWEAGPAADVRLPSHYNEVIPAEELPGAYSLGGKEIPKRFESVPRYVEPANKTVPGTGPIEDPVLVTSAERAKTPRSELFDKTTLPDDQGMVDTFVQRAEQGVASRVADWVREVTPRTQAIIDRYPESNLVTSTERFLQASSKKLFEFKTSEMGRLEKYPAEDWLKAEQTAYDVYRKTGNRGQALAEVAKTHPEIADQIDRLRTDLLPRVQEARKTLGVEPLTPEMLEPIYVPRMTDLSKDAITYVGTPTGGLRGMRSSLGSFSQPRVNEMTMLEQMNKGLAEFRDPRISYLYYERLAGELEATANYVKELEGSTLFKSAKAARQAGYPNPVEIRAFVPNGRTWYVADKDVAQFFKDNFDKASGPVQSGLHYLNQIFRNPNLLNPLPHTSNITWHYKVSGGSMVKLPNLVREYLKQLKPEKLKLFNEYVPHSPTLKTEHELFREMKMLLNGKELSNAIRQVASLPTKPSQKVLWEWVDPAIKYARWSQYVDKGMSPQAAANHTMIDLVRYQERGGVLTFMKSIPMNFFAPYRWGNFAATVKAMKDHPLKLVLTVGMVDYIREMIYRNTGWWMSLPIDRFEAPVYQLAKAGGHMAHGEFMTALKDTGYALTSTFAPGITARFRDAFSPGDLDTLLKQFWGWTQIGEAYSYGKEALEKGDVSLMFKALGTMMGARDTVMKRPGKPPMSFTPSRLSAAFPEALPGMDRSPKVKFAENQRNRREDKQEEFNRERFWRNHPTLRQQLYGK